jgi:GAF domain-containing protein
VLNQLENINWAGFYLVEGDTLYLGPFQGEVACTIIKKGKGVCGTSFEKGETIIVPDVNKFPGHIACSSKSRSEIVTPIFKNNKVVGVIDIDAPIYDRFHEEEKKLLENIAKELEVLDF